MPLPWQQKVRSLVATQLERPVVCKCGEEFTTLEQVKVHYLVMSVMPLAHVKKEAKNA